MGRRRAFLDEGPRVLLGLFAWAGLTCAAAPEGAAQAPDGLRGTVVVVNKRASTASFIDVASGRIVGTAPTGEGPHELVVSSDGRVAVGTDYAGSRPSLTVFDVATASRIDTHRLEGYPRPHGIAFLPGDSLVVVTSETAGAVIVVRVADGEVLEDLRTEANGSHMLGVTADGGTIWTGDMGSNTVTELSRRTGAKVRSFQAPETPEAVNVTPDGRRVFAGSNATGRVTAWETATGAPTTVGEGFQWPYRVFLTPGTEVIIIPDLGHEVVRFFDGGDYDELGRIDFRGEGPQGLILHPDGQHLFLSLSAADRIAIIDIQARAVVGYLPAGAGPDGIGYSPLLIAG